MKRSFVLFVLVCVAVSLIPASSAVDGDPAFQGVAFGAYAYGPCAPGGVLSGMILIGGQATPVTRLSWQSGYPGWEAFPCPCPSSHDSYVAENGTVQGHGVVAVSGRVDGVPYSMFLTISMENARSYFWPETDSFQIGYMFSARRWAHFEGFIVNGSSISQVSGDGFVSVYVWAPGMLPAGSYYGEPDFKGCPEGLSMIQVYAPGLFNVQWTSRTVDLHYNVHPFSPKGMVLPASTVRTWVKLTEPV